MLPSLVIELFALFLSLRLLEILSINELSTSYLPIYLGALCSPTDQRWTWRMLLNVQASKYTYIWRPLCPFAVLRLDIGNNCPHVRFLPSHTHHNFSWPPWRLRKGGSGKDLLLFLDMRVNKLHHSNKIWPYNRLSLPAWLCSPFRRTTKDDTGCKFQHQKRATGFLLAASLVNWQLRETRFPGSSKDRQQLMSLRSKEGVDGSSIAPALSPISSALSPL